MPYSRIFRKLASVGEAEMQHVAVLHHIFLAFQAELAGLARARLALVGDIVVIGDGLGADKALFEIRMDDARRSRAARALLDGPGAGLFRADGEIGHQMQELVARADDPVEAGFGEAHRVQIILLVFQRQHRDLALDLGGDDHRDRALGGRMGLHLVREVVALIGGALLDIADIEHGLGRQQPQAREGLALLGIHLGGAGGLALAQGDQAARHEVEEFLRVLVAALGLLFQRHDALFEAFEIGQHQLGLDGLDVADGVDLALDMGDVGIFKAAHHMGDGVAFPDIGEKLVAQALALGGAAHEARDIHEGETGGDDLLGARDLRQRLEPHIGHRHVAHIGLDGAEGVIGRLRRRRLGQRVEEGGLADIRQANDAAFEAHDASTCLGEGALRRSRW